MSTKRMFSMKIVDTDAFIDMPTSSQLLYFHLAMRADDDGFVSSPKKILRMIGAGEDDYKVLIAKKFIIPFESGICVIKHWLIHNLIRNDRYIPTQYVKEKCQLVIDDKTKKYSLIKLISSKVIPNGNQMATIGCPRLGKSRLDKDRSGEEREAPSAPCLPNPDQEEIFQSGKIMKEPIDLVGENSVGDYVIPYDLLDRNNSTPEYEQVETIIDIFRTRDPNMKKAYGNKFYRAVIVLLTRQYGFEQIKNLTILAVKLQSEKYAPKIYNPIDLRDNMVKLRSYIEIQLKNQSNIISG